jgi:hypothetical protein
VDSASLDVIGKKNPGNMDGGRGSLVRANLLSRQIAVRCQPARILECPLGLYARLFGNDLERCAVLEDGFYGGATNPASLERPVWAI